MVAYGVVLRYRSSLTGRANKSMLVRRQDSMQNRLGHHGSSNYYQLRELLEFVEGVGCGAFPITTLRNSPWVRNTTPKILASLISLLIHIV